MGGIRACAQCGAVELHVPSCIARTCSELAGQVANRRARRSGMGGTKVHPSPTGRWKQKDQRVRVRRGHHGQTGICPGRPYKHEQRWRCTSQRGASATTITPRPWEDGDTMQSGGGARQVHVKEWAETQGEGAKPTLTWQSTRVHEDAGRCLYVSPQYPATN